MKKTSLIAFLLIIPFLTGAGYSGTNAPAYPDFLYKIGNGGIPQRTGQLKFGHASAISTSYTDVWDAKGAAAVYNWISGTAAIQVSSGDANDASGDAGARTVVLQGLDENWAFQEETITLNGQGTVACSLAYKRVFRAYVKTAGASQVNEGKIYFSLDGAAVSSGVPTNVTELYLVIEATAGQTLHAPYTIRAGRTARLLSINVEQGTSNRVVDWRLFVRDNAAGEGWRVKLTGHMADGGSSNYSFAIPLTIPAQADVTVLAKSGGAADVSVFYELVEEGN